MTVTKKTRDSKIRRQPVSRNKRKKQWEEEMQVMGANFAAFVSIGVIIQFLMGEDFKSKANSLLLVFAVSRLLAIVGIALPEEEMVVED